MLARRLRFQVAKLARQPFVFLFGPGKIGLNAPKIAPGGFRSLDRALVPFENAGDKLNDRDNPGHGLRSGRDIFLDHHVHRARGGHVQRKFGLARVVQVVVVRELTARR